MEKLLRVERQRRTPFLASGDDLGRAKAVILGAPMDWTSSFRPGSRSGPGSIREVSEGIEEYSFYRDRSLLDLDFYDAGDLVLPFGNTEASLALIRESVAAIADLNKFPLILGGEHLVTYAAVAALRARHEELCVIQFDAHADLRPAYMGQALSHASVMRLIHGLLGDGRIHQIGIRSGDREEFEFARAHTRFHEGDFLAGVKAAVCEIGRRPVYISVDIDVVDPAFAPGTGTPECGGPTSSELLRAFDLLGTLNAVGFDLVEVLPATDLSSRTSLLAAVLLREALLGLVGDKGGDSVRKSQEHARD